MTTAVQRRRGTNTEHASFTGLEGELSVNTTNESVHVHDGSTAGGFELARADGSNIVATSIDINGGTIDGTTIGASSASTGAFTTLTATGIDVTGTATMDGLVVNTGSYGAVEAGSGRMYGSSSHGLVIQGSGTTNDFLFLGSDGSDSFRIANNGDISFYEDTGTTAKLFWDASAEFLGIGTSSPDRLIDLRTAPAEDWQIRLGANNSDADTYDIGRDTGDGLLYFKGNQTGYTGYVFDSIDGERARIDSSGNLNIGTTGDVTSTNAGVQLRADNTIRVAKSGASAMSLYRHTNDGSIISFYKDGTSVGSIGVSGGNNLFISGQAADHAGLTFATQSVLPTTQGAINNNTVDLGQSGNAFKDLYFAGRMYGNFLRAGETLPSSTDFNDLKTSGFYRVDNNATNAPSTTFHALVIYGNSSNVVTQIATALASTTTYVRSFNTAWTSWARLDT